VADAGALGDVLDPGLVPPKIGERVPGGLAQPGRRPDGPGVAGVRRPWIAHEGHMVTKQAGQIPRASERSVRAPERISSA
jgi:hypothetical protein